MTTDNRSNEHVTTCTDETVRGYPGTSWKCSCGAKGAWAVRDGSAEADAHQHTYANDPVYRARQDERYAAWASEQREKGCKCTHVGGYVMTRSGDCIMHKPRNIYKQPLPLKAHHEHGCSCHLSGPCGRCENCKHWDYPECENDCQTCEEHDDD